jgi:hypothetical protein
MKASNPSVRAFILCGVALSLFELSANAAPLTLTGWLVTNDASPFVVTDDDAPLLPQRFFRARLLP